MGGSPNVFLDLLSITGLFTGRGGKVRTGTAVALVVLLVVIVLATVLQLLQRG